MAPKPSRQEYLKQQVATAKAAGAPANVIADLNKQINAAGKNIKRAPEGAVNVPGTVEYIDNQINQLLYGTSGSGAGGIANRAAPGYVPPTEEAPPPPDPGAALAAEQRRQFELTQSLQKQQQRQSAFDLAKSFAVQYGLGESIADRIVDLTVNQGYTETALTLALQQSPEYKERFSGLEKYKQNFASDIAAGRKAQPLTPSQYIKAEQEYQEILSRYGLKDLASQGTFSELIGGDVSAIELKDRVENVYDKIRNADSVLKEQLATYFPTLTEADFAKSLLTGKNPEDMATSLKRRVSQAEISSEAARAGLGGLTVGRAAELEQMGLTRTIARAGYSRIAEQQTVLNKLGSIYQQDVTGLQTELEAEQFQGLASQRRKKLEQTEQATFAGRSGVSQVSLSQQGTAGTL
jgi:hypothetical protein